MILYPEDIAELNRQAMLALIRAADTAVEWGTEWADEYGKVRREVLALLGEREDFDGPVPDYNDPDN